MTGSQIRGLWLSCKKNLLRKLDQERVSTKTMEGVGTRHSTIGQTALCLHLPSLPTCLCVDVTCYMQNNSTSWAYQYHVITLLMVRLEFSSRNTVPPNEPEQPRALLPHYLAITNYSGAASAYLTHSQSIASARLAMLHCALQHRLVRAAERGQCSSLG